MRTTARLLRGMCSTAMGFYPVCPGTDEYILGTPYFKQMKLHLENGKTVTISAPK